MSLMPKPSPQTDFGMEGLNQTWEGDLTDFVGRVALIDFRGED
jgi:hypothetical protein